MKNIILALVFLTILTGCKNRWLSNKELVETYYSAKNKKNFSEIKHLVNDSITIISGDYVMLYNKQSFYEVFKWDSIFKTSYKMVDLIEENNQIIASVELNSIKLEFLKNPAMTCDYKISFTSNRISKIEEINCKNANWNLWQQERDSLVKWTKKNHQNLDGFIHDMTMNGAINYVKAIEFYKSEKNL